MILNPNIKISIIILFLMAANFICGPIARAQEKNEEVTVVAPYEPTISDAFKINISPKLPELSSEKQEFDLSVKKKAMNKASELQPIKPAKIMGESVTKLYKNYIRAGFGNYTTPYLEFYANNLRSKKGAFGVHFKHLSSSGKIKDYAPAGYSDNELNVRGKRFFKSHTLSSNAWFKRNSIHYYGFKPDNFPEISLSKSDLKQSYNRLGASLKFEDNYTKGHKLKHTFSFDYQYLFDKFDSREHNILFKGDLSKDVNFFNFTEDQILGFETKVDYYFNSDSAGNDNSGIIQINPFYRLRFSQYKFYLGLNTILESDSSIYVHFYPTLHLEVLVVKDALITYAGIKGGLVKNSFSSISLENPYIDPYLEKRFTNYKFEQYGGLKGRLGKYLDYNLSFINSTIDNMPFFVNDTASVMGEGLNNQFVVVYDRVKYSRVIAEFGFRYNEKLSSMLRGKYRSYFMDNEEKPWHKPALEISWMVDYNIQDKFIIKAELKTSGKMYARTFETQTSGNTTTTIQVPVEIKGVTDISLGVEYRYSKALSGFVNFNNLLGQRYYRWYNYPSYRFNMMLGVGYSF